MKIIAVVFLCLLTFCGCSENKENKENKNAKKTVEISSSPKNITSEIQSKSYVELRSQNLDTSLGARRVRYDIQIPQNTEESQIDLILNEAVDHYKKKREVDAMVIRLYWKNSEIPYAMAEWAPYGIWSKAEKGVPKSLFKIKIRENIDGSSKLNEKGGFIV